MKLTQWVNGRAVPEPFKDRLRVWRGPRLMKEAAGDLGVNLGTYSKWEYGSRVPDRFWLPEIEKRMAVKPYVPPPPEPEPPKKGKRGKKRKKK